MAEPSLIAQITALASQTGAINLAEGLPDFEAPSFLREAQEKIISRHSHQAAPIEGDKSLREAIAHWLAYYQSLSYLPEEILVTTGATEAFYLACACHLRPGDEVILLEPFYECYRTVLEHLGVTPVYVALTAPSWKLDSEALHNALSPRTKMLILNSPSNPTGKVFSQGELEAIANLSVKHDFMVLSDEVYNHLVYPQSESCETKQFRLMPLAPSIACIEGLKERSIVINSLSKTYSATGWRVGFAAAPASLLMPMIALHEVLTCGTSSLHQAAAIAAYQAPQEYYLTLRQQMLERQKIMSALLGQLGLNCLNPDGAYYYWVDSSSLGFADDATACTQFIKQYGFAAVPGRAFFRPETKTHYVRFCYAKRIPTLQKALQQVKAAKPALLC